MEEQVGLGEHAQNLAFNMEDRFLLKRKIRKEKQMLVWWMRQLFKPQKGTAYDPI